MRLLFSDEVISGSGVDGDGPFGLRGRYDRETEFVLIEKTYSRLLVQYRGEWDGQIISGISTITAPGFFDTGSFEIWPESDEENLRIAQELQLETTIPSDSPLIGNLWPSRPRPPF